MTRQRPWQRVGAWVLTVALLLSMLPTAAFAAGGKTIYTDMTKSETGDGSSAKPYKNFEDALAAAEDGDTIVIQGKSILNEKLVGAAGVPCVIDKAITIQSEGESAALYVRTAGIVLAADVTLLQIELNFQNRYHNAIFANGHSFIVTKTCKHPDVAVKWVDWLMSEEGKIKSQDRGLTITRKAKDGELGVDGRQALWTIEQKSAEEQAKYSEGMQNLAWYNSGIYYSSLESSLRTCDPENKSAELYKLYSTYDKYGTDKYKQITIADEDIDAYTDYQSIKDETEASFAKFVTGEYDLDKDWDKYVAGLNNLGLKEYMKLLQRNYDAVK